MSTWKKVLTSDDLSTGSGSNLSTSNLEQEDSTRTYKVRPEYTDGDGLLEFNGVFGSSASFPSPIPLLQLNAEVSTHEVYLSAISGTYIGSNGGSRYQLPQANTCSAGKFMVGSTSTASVFDTVDEVLKPGGSGLFHSENDAVNVGDDVPIRLEDDSVLLYDDSENKFVHVTVSQLVAAGSKLRTTLIFSREAEAASNFYLNGMNNIAHSADFGYTVPRKCRVAGGSLSYIKSASSGVTVGGGKRVKVVKNGAETGPASFPFGTDYSGQGVAVGDPVFASLTALGGSNELAFTAGDRVSIRMQSSPSSEFASKYQVILVLEDTA